jgi:hypothetical protein
MGYKKNDCQVNAVNTVLFERIEREYPIYRFCEKKLISHNSRPREHFTRKIFFCVAPFDVKHFLNFAKKYEKHSRDIHYSGGERREGRRRGNGDEKIIEGNLLKNSTLLCGFHENCFQIRERWKKKIWDC